MGCPCLYHTPEQQHIANRAKSHRHYQRNKIELQDRRRSNYHESMLQNKYVSY
ncbi:hypothetical protein L208DRAFT_1234021 [Tricholoma matsutake]|nr:hypothetical protein L208DRAFT_1234021 [Tricholoma matsutake 945]